MWILRINVSEAGGAQQQTLDWERKATILCCFASADWSDGFAARTERSPNVRVRTDGKLRVARLRSRCTAGSTLLLQRHPQRWLQWYLHHISSTFEQTGKHTSKNVGTGQGLCLCVFLLKVQGAPRGNAWKSESLQKRKDMLSVYNCLLICSSKQRLSFCQRFSRKLPERGSLKKALGTCASMKVYRCSPWCVPRELAQSWRLRRKGCAYWLQRNG